MSRDDLVEKVARAFVAPLGYNTAIDWERIYIGGYATEEPSDLASLCRALARAIIPIVAEACAALAEGCDLPDRDWMPQSLYATIRREVAQRIRQTYGAPHDQ